MNPSFAAMTFSKAVGSEYPPAQPLAGPHEACKEETVRKGSNTNKEPIYPIYASIYAD